MDIRTRNEDVLYQALRQTCERLCAAYNSPISAEEVAEDAITEANTHFRPTKKHRHLFAMTTKTEIMRVRVTADAIDMQGSPMVEDL